MQASSLSQRTDSAVLAEVRGHCRLVGNRLVVDEAWLARKIAMAAVDGAMAAQAKPKAQTFLELVNVPGNIMRIKHGRDHRERVVARMDKLDATMAEVHSLAASGNADELAVQMVIAQALASYFTEIDALWRAYVVRHESPLMDHEPWPGE